MSAFSDFCREIAPVVAAAANGDDVQFMGSDGIWYDKPVNGFIPARLYRIKPKTVAIGGVEVNAPTKVAPKVYSRYYIPNITVDKLHSVGVWSLKERDFRYLDMGLVHLEKDDAISHAKALLSLTSK